MDQEERSSGVGNDRENIGDAEKSQVREHCRSSFCEGGGKPYSIGSKLQEETGDGSDTAPLRSGQVGDNSGTPAI